MIRNKIEVFSVLNIIIGILFYLLAYTWKRYFREKYLTYTNNHFKYHMSYSKY